MSQAWDIFNNAYIKKMRRPEFWGFNPDQASGSSMLFRSEETNPWAGRDTANARFGPMGASSGIKAPPMNQQGAEGLLKGFGIQPPSILGANQDSQFGQLLNANVPQQESVLASLSGPLAHIGGRIGANAIMDLFPKGFERLSPEMQGYAKMFTEGPGIPLAKEGLAGTESGLGGYEKLAEQLAEGATEEAGSFTDLFAGIDPATVAAAAAPMLAKMFGLKGTGADVLGAAASTGAAGAQGFMNPFSDLAALYSLFKFGRGLF